MKAASLLSAFASVALVGSAQAGVIFTSDFSSDAVANPAPDTLVDGWVFDNTLAGDMNGATDSNEHRVYDSSATGGARFDSRGWVSIVSGSFIYVDLGAATADTTYTVDAFIGAETGLSANTVDWSIELLVGSTFASATQLGVETGVDLGDADGKNADEYHQLVASTGSTVTGNVYLKIERTGGINGFIFVDDVAVDASPVPEPGSMALLGLGGMMLIRRRRA